jgi:hypothetical protein
MVMSIACLAWIGAAAFMQPPSSSGNSSFHRPCGISMAATWEIACTDTRHRATGATPARHSGCHSHRRQGAAGSQLKPPPPVARVCYTAAVAAQRRGMPGTSLQHSGRLAPGRQLTARVGHPPANIAAAARSTHKHSNPRRASMSARGCCGTTAARSHTQGGGRDCFTTPHRATPQHSKWGTKEGTGNCVHQRRAEAPGPTRGGVRVVSGEARSRQQQAAPSP